MFLLVSALAAAAVVTHHMQLIDLRQLQQQLLAPLQVWGCDIVLAGTGTLTFLLRWCDSERVLFTSLQIRSR